MADLIHQRIKSTGQTSGTGADALTEGTKDQTPLRQPVLRAAFIGAVPPTPRLKRELLGLRY